MKNFLSLITLNIICLSCCAQSLPTVQKNSLAAPVDMKIDGKANDWGNKFQAYNKSTSVFYSISNSKDKLFLIIKAVDPNICDKILAGGITFSINDKKNAADKGSVKITFPNINQMVRSKIIHKIKDSKVQIDSELTSINNQLVASSKIIRVTGITSISDTSLSIYNDVGIRAASLFDNQRALTYELSIPLKYFEQFINNRTFFYDIKLNGLQPGSMKMQVNGKTVDMNSPEAQSLMATLSSSSNIPSATQDLSTGKVTIQRTNPLQNLINPTDFSGKYNLITQ